MQYSYGDKYIGEWNKGLKHGSGVLKYADGSLYEGEWQNDLAEGKGIMVGSY